LFWFLRSLTVSNVDTVITSKCGNIVERKRVTNGLQVVD
jgi:hypothetical protein